MNKHNTEVKKNTCSIVEEDYISITYVLVHNILTTKLVLLKLHFEFELEYPPTQKGGTFSPIALFSGYQQYTVIFSSVTFNLLK